MDWQVLLQQILAIVLGLVGTAASVFFTLWIKRVAEKRGIDLDQARLDEITTAIRNGVYVAERWGRLAENKPTGSEKLDYALNAIKGVLSNSTVKNFADDKLKMLVESFIQQEYKYINEKQE